MPRTMLARLVKRRIWSKGAVAFATLLVVLSGALPTQAQSQDGPFESVKAQNNLPLTTDPSSELWRAARPVFAEKDPYGKIVPGARMEVRSRWTNTYLYFLFICPYRELHLKPSPDTQKETYELWNWDVAEVFLGSDFQDIKRYKEFEVSPQNEWIDLDVNLHNPHHEEGWVWNSGFEHAARIDSGKHLWYAAMKIPMSAIDSRPVKAGNTFRANLYLSQGVHESYWALTWQPPMGDSFHAPSHFGLLTLAP